jgi:hypothetical protein
MVPPPDWLVFGAVVVVPVVAIIEIGRRLVLRNRYWHDAKAVVERLRRLRRLTRLEDSVRFDVGLDRVCDDLMKRLRTPVLIGFARHLRDAKTVCLNEIHRGRGLSTDRFLDTANSTLLQATTAIDSGDAMGSFDAILDLYAIADPTSAADDKLGFSPECLSIVLHEGAAAIWEGQGDIVAHRLATALDSESILNEIQPTSLALFVLWWLRLQLMKVAQTHGATDRGTVWASGHEWTALQVARVAKAFENEDWEGILEAVVASTVYHRVPRLWARANISLPKRWYYFGDDRAEKQVSACG